MKIACVLVLVASTVSPAAAQFCKPQDFAGGYGFQLSGTTTISGNPKPVAALGRLEFDGSGALSGSASVNFAGYFLGNPVTGAYEVKQDCTITWSMQDDSGAFQHFAGKLTPDLQRATFHQTDTGGARQGTLAKVSTQCSSAAFQGAYTFSISGGVIPMMPGQTAQKVSLDGTLSADAAGNLSLLRGDEIIAAGTATVDTDCIVEMALEPPIATMKLRGVLVAGGKEILAIESDPGAAVNAQFHAKPPAPR